MLSSDAAKSASPVGVSASLVIRGEFMVEGSEIRVHFRLRISDDARAGNPQQQLRPSQVVSRTPRSG